DGLVAPLAAPPVGLSPDLVVQVPRLRADLTAAFDHLLVHLDAAVEGLLGQVGATLLGPGRDVGFVHQRFHGLAEFAAQLVDLVLELLFLKPLPLTAVHRCTLSLTVWISRLVLRTACSGTGGAE